MDFHPEVMPDAQQRVLKKLGEIVRPRFYLAGGTAIAIQIGHRESVDLDWFTREVIAEPLDLAASLTAAGLGFSITGSDKGTLHGEVDGVKLSFLEYRYPLVRSLVTWPEYGCQMASLEDLACMKLSAVGSRGAKKDFIDVYALGHGHLSLAQMLGLYQEKYETADLLHVLSSLTYFDDAEPEAMPTMLTQVDWSDIKRMMKRWVAEYGHAQAPSGQP
jgi:hypothetical protein